MLTFSDGWVLWGLAPLFVAWLGLSGWLALWRRRRGQSTAIRYSSLERVKRLRSSRSVYLRRAVQALRVITVALILLGMARPQTGRRLTQIKSEGIDIVLVVDTSGSMRALDLDSNRPMRQRRDRLDVAKGVVERFVEKRDNDLLGLVVFGEQAFTQCPLTLDREVLLSLLEGVEIGMAGADRTALGSALGIAVKRLRESQAKSKVVVLLTDGRSNAGVLSPLKAAEIAATFGIKVYTVGAGARGRAPFLMQSDFGQRIVYDDVEIDEETLQRIASLTGGTYFRAEDESALVAVYDEIDELEKSEITTDSYVEYEERFSAFVAPALVLLLLEVLLLGSRFRKLP